MGGGNTHDQLWLIASRMNWVVRAIARRLHHPYECKQSKSETRSGVSRNWYRARTDAKRSRLDAKRSHRDAKRSHYDAKRSHSVDFWSVLAARVESMALDATQFMAY